MGVGDRVRESGGGRMSKDDIAKMDNETLIGTFVSNVGYDYSTDYSPHAYPDWSEETKDLWSEIENRMQKPTVLDFDGESCIGRIREEIQKQKDITDGQADYSTSYHVGIISGLNDAWRIIEESVRRGENEQGNNKKDV